jgi:integrase
MKASLYVRVRMTDGKYLTTKPAYTPTKRIRPQYALIDGNAERFESATYVLRYVKDGKPSWETVGTDPNLALAKLERLNHAFKGAKLGLVPTVEVVSPAPREEAPSPAAVTGTRRVLADAIVEYLEDIRLTKKPKTYAAYNKALDYFQESCKKTHLEDIVRRDMQQFAAFLRDEKEQAPRSCWNKFSNVMSFLKTYDIRKIVKPGDWPSYVEEEPEIYEPEDLDAFFGACTAQERVWFEFFLMTGMREQEVMHCAWRNVNFKQGTVSVSWKPEFNWTPKAYKEREIPVPAALLNALAAIKPADSRRLIFPTSGGLPKFDFLDCCKTIAKRAGLDPDNFWLHKFRATFATMHLQAGVDLRTVQAFMGHTDLASTMRYLKPARGATVQAKVNATFAQIGGAA